MLIPSPTEILILMLAGIFVFGLVSIILGIYQLTFRSMGKDVREIARQTKQLAQKGLVSEISGLVGTASALLNATSEMSKTSRGTGWLLIFTGLVELILSTGAMIFLVQGLSL